MGRIYKVCRWDGSGAMIYMPSFIKTGSGIQKLTGGGYIDRQEGDRKSLLEESRLKTRANNGRFRWPQADYTPVRRR
jgi:hypothetical protein